MARIAEAYHLEIWDLVQRRGIPASRIKRTPEVVAAPHRPARGRGRPARETRRE